MTQTGLIDDIIHDLGLNTPLTKYEKHNTPATEVLQSDSDKPAFNEQWSYRSIIGKLNFLAQNTRPDISFAVHQCAKFCNNPCQSHGIAIKQIGRYLKATADKGLILRPDGTNQLNAYVDADFCGAWSYEQAYVRDHNLSRAGYVITYSGCPIYWKSTLEKQIALSTCEAEYIALSMCCRSLIPMRRLMIDIFNKFSIHLDQSKTDINSKLGNSVILEDNAVAITLANDGDKYRPRTKHLSIKWHHF